MCLADVAHRAGSCDRRGSFKNNDIAAYLEQSMCACAAGYAAANNYHPHNAADRLYQLWLNIMYWRCTLLQSTEARLKSNLMYYNPS